MNRKQRFIIALAWLPLVVVGAFAALWCAMVVVLLAMGAASSFVAEDDPIQEVEKKEEVEVISIHKNDKHGFKIWTDPDTGCEYIVKRSPNSAAITPRMETSGKIKGC